MTAVKIRALEEMARNMVRDGKRPNLYFVTDAGIVVTVTRDVEIATKAWEKLAARRPLVESALEDRLTGCISSVEPIEDDSTILRIYR